MNHYISAIIVVLFVLIFCVVGCEFIPPEVITTEPVEKVAIANITAVDGSSLTGTATFTEAEMGVHAVIEIQNTTPGLHASHLHIGNCADVGPHWHPMGVPTGNIGIPVAEATLETPPIGIGEIGNIPVDENGTGVLEFTTPSGQLAEIRGTDILGKLILIHETGDTFRTHPHLHGSPMIHTDMKPRLHIPILWGQTEPVQATHLCTLAVLGQQVDLGTAHHLPGEAVSPHTHDLLELLLKCFLKPEQLVDPRIAFYYST